MGSEEGKTGGQEEKMKGVRAIGLHSGGLDSILADAVVRSLGVEVRSIHFFTGLCGNSKADVVAEDGKLGIQRELVDISGEEYLHMVANPKFGYGAHANPCIDCRIMMLRKAKALMDEWGASFVFTGEVMGQRPKSQRREAMKLVEKESGLEGRLLRPLSAQFLEETIPEQEGLIDRTKLLGLKGRTRKPQMSLARQLGITSYPQPAGGCWLTDENFGRRFHDLMARRNVREVTRDEMMLLLTGRHFRVSECVRLIISRNEEETVEMERFVPGRIRMEASEVNGPIALIEGQPTEAELTLMAQIVARYGQGKNQDQVRIRWTKSDGDRGEISVAPLKDEPALETMRL